MSGKVIAVYSLKGGVGKPTLVVNLAWAAAILSSQRTLARCALDTIADHLGVKAARAVLMPVFSMVNKRRTLHRSVVEAAADWPIIPMASAYERMTEARAPVGALFGRRSAPVQTVAGLWQAVEKRLAKG